MRGSAVASCRVRSTECSNACIGPFEGGRHYLHYLHHSLAPGQTTGREHSPAHQQKIGWKIYWNLLFIVWKSGHSMKTWTSSPLYLLHYLVSGIIPSKMNEWMDGWNFREQIILALIVPWIFHEKQSYHIWQSVLLPSPSGDGYRIMPIYAPLSAQFLEI